MLGSPVYGRLAGLLADNPSSARHILGDDASWDLGLRLFGGVHGLVLAGTAPAALSGDPGDFLAALDGHADELRRFVAEQGVQTNETQRCAGLLPAFLTIARQARLPLDLLELGPSAGLNLLFDRYRYVFANGAWGDPAALLSLAVAERAAVPAELLQTPLQVRRRRGIDLAPVDVTSEDGVRLLHAFLWPGLEARVSRLEAAIETLRRERLRPDLVQGDYLELLPALLTGRADDAVTLVFQTASTGYLSAEGRIELRTVLEQAGADGRPLAWVSTRAPDEREHERDDAWELELRVWPEPARMVGWLDFHGNWLEWIG